MLKDTHKTISPTCFCLLLISVSLFNPTVMAQTNQSETKSINADWQSLLTTDLSGWEIWQGVPHTSVQGLPEQTHTAENLNLDGDTSKTIGLGQNIKNVFSVNMIDGNPELEISGEIYGGLTTLAEYENYHLSLEFKWGGKKWAPRLHQKRDSGLLFHCQGAHGVFWQVWKACQELQIQETDIGDYIPLAGPSGMIKTDTETGEPKYQPLGKNLHLVKGYSHASKEVDMPHGEWNTVELFAYGDAAIFRVNGVVVMKIESSRDKAGKPLTKGQIQLQSEGAQVFYRNIKIKTITGLPSI